MTRPILSATVLAALVLTLTACVPSPDVVAKPTAPTTNTTPSAEPTPPANPLSTVETIVIRPELIELVDATGATLAELSYDAETDEIVNALTEVIGSSPLVEEFEGRCCEAPKMTFYRWPGLQITDDHMGSFAADGVTWVPEDVPDDRHMNVIVIVVAATVGDIRITTDPGFDLGDDLVELATSVGRPYTGTGFEQIPVETGAERGPEQIEGEPNAYSVVVQSHPSDGYPRVVAPINLGVGSV